MGEPPPSKRPRLSASDETFCFDLPAAHGQWHNTAFEQPVHLASFSYAPSRDLLLPSSNRHNEALRLYTEPPLGADLSRGQHEAVLREEGIAEGLDALLDTLLDMDPAVINNVLLRASVITWRGMVTRLLKAVYASHASDSWQMNAQMVDGTLYLEDHLTDAIRGERSRPTTSHRQAIYAFESFCTTDLDGKRAADGWGGPVNTNVQWCSIVKTKLGGSLRLIMGGEVDAVLKPPNGPIKTSDFVELKTHGAIASRNQEIGFERSKLLSMYLQSFLLGVRTIVVGFRSRSGQITALQTFRTLDIPRLVRGKPHGWDPAAALTVGHDILCWLRDSISAQPDSSECQTRFLNSTGEDDLRDIAYPVFRVSFDALSRQLTLRRINNEERTALLTEAGRTQRERAGFIPVEWVVAMAARRKEQQQQPCDSSATGLPVKA